MITNIKYDLKKWLLNKYVITCLIFIFIFTFCGEQSFINRTRNAIRIAALKKEKALIVSQAEQYRYEIEMLEHNVDSLERFAREHYYMHSDGETVYLISE